MSLITEIIRPALAALPLSMRSTNAERELAAISLQEDGGTARKQVNGPARGLWQFEPNGVRAVLHHPSSAKFASRLVALAGLGDRTPAQICEALATNDALACQLARLLLFTDPEPLPGADDEQAGWDIYQRTWRPGRPRPETWPRNWAAALRMADGEMG